MKLEEEFDKMVDATEKARKTPKQLEEDKKKKAALEESRTYH